MADSARPSGADDQRGGRPTERLQPAPRPDGGLHGRLRLDAGQELVSDVELPGDVTELLEQLDPSQSVRRPDEAGEVVRLDRPLLDRHSRLEVADADEQIHLGPATPRGAVSLLDEVVEAPACLGEPTLPDQSHQLTLAVERGDPDESLTVGRGLALSGEGAPFVEPAGADQRIGQLCSRLERNGSRPGSLGQGHHRLHGRALVGQPTELVEGPGCHVPAFVLRLERARLVGDLDRLVCRGQGSGVLVMVVVQRGSGAPGLGQLAARRPRCERDGPLAGGDAVDDSVDVVPAATRRW